MKTLKLRLAASAALVLGLVFAASATTYYVDASRPDNNDDGLSEATAKRDISAAIFSSAAGDVILVKPGTYTERISTGKELTIRSTDGAEKTFIFTENTEAVSIANGAKTTMIDGFTLSSVGSSYAIWGGTFTNCVIAKCGGSVQSCSLQRSTVAYNDQGVRGAYNVNVSDDCLLWGNPVVSETAPDPCFADPEGFDFRLRAFSPEAYTNPLLGYYQGPLVEGRFVRVAVDGVGELERDLVNLVADGGSITLKCATTSPRPVVRWIDENGETIVNGGDYELSADSLTIKNVTADRRITACFERKTWYVNADTGDDAGKDGLSEGNPFKTITKALASALDLDTILVAKGTYAEGCDVIDHNKYPKLRVTDGRRLTIRATGARAETIIDGGNETSCLWLNDKQTINTNVVVDGLTLQNGQASWLTGVGAIGGGAFGGLLRNCTIQNCTAGSGSSGYGGGAAYARLENCTVTGCKAHSEGGALRGCDAEACVITGNSMGGNSSSARGCATYSGTLVNCLIADNEFESTVEGGMGAVYRSKLYGCTVTGNRNNASSDRYGAGVYGDASYTTLYNTIVYDNLSDGQPDELQNVDGADLVTCCTNDPSLVNAAAGDYRLKPTSICHNAGKNRYVIGTLDVAGEARIQEWTVDLGAYEYCPIMTITAAPTQATAGTAYSYPLTQTGGAEPVAWMIDAASETKNVAGEVTDSSTFSAAGEKLFDGGGGSFTRIDLPFAFPYGGTTYTRAGICNYGAVTLGDGPSFSVYTSCYDQITDSPILSMPVILPYLAYNWGTSGEDGCGIFVDQSVPQQVTIRWATYYNSDRYRANFSMTLYADGAIRFSYGDIDEGYDAPKVIGLSFGDGEHYLDMLSSFGGSNANDILFHPLAIPEGISLDGNQLVGMPTKGGTYRFRVTATEAGGEAQSKIVTMDVLSNYTLKFDGNGNKTGTAPDDKSLTSVEEYVLPEPGMACGCASFLGWATNATGAAVYQPGDRVKCLTTEPGATVTLYAAWENIFVLQFDGNASGVIGAHVAYTNEIGATFNIYRDTGPQTNIVDFGNKYMPCRVGWYLNNWNMCADGSGETFLQNATSSQWSQSVSSESFGANRGDVITLHAQWSESDWDFYWADPQLGGGKWIVRLKGDEGAKLWSVSGAVAWPESLTLPASYCGRTVSSLATTFRYMTGDPAHAIGQIVVPEGYTNLADQAFWSLYHLESITFPSTLKVIPQYCCEDCTNLTSIGFSEGNRVVGYGAFTRCTALSAVELSLGLTNLEANAFYNCTNLTAVVLSPDYVGGTSGSYQFYNCPIAKLEIPASCQGFGYQSLNQTKALRFLGDLPSWNVYNANYQFAALIEYPATNTTWNAGPIANYSAKPHKGFVGPVAAFGVTDAYFWTNANETVTFAYAESPLAATVTLPEGAISWGGVDWEIVGFEADAFDGQPTTVYYPISEYAKWEQVTPPEGITLAPVPGTFFTLTFDANGGDTYVPATMTFPPSGVRTLPSAVPTKSAYKFLGWATTADGAIAYQPGDDYTAGAAGGSATLFAKWEEVGNYTLKYMTGAPYVDPPADREVAVGSTVQIAADVLVRTGWTFDGWTNSVGALYAPGADFTSDTAKDGTAYLYAKWSSKSGSASWTDDEGTKWHYGFNGDSLWITSVDPAPGITELPDPLTFVIGGTKVTQVNTGAVPAYVDGLWWRYQELDDNEAKLLGTMLSGPTDLVLPSVIAGRTVTAFVAVDNGFVNTKSYITSVEIPGTVKEVPFGAFQSCNNLTRAVLHEGTEALRDNVFLYDNALATPIDFPSTLTDVSAYAFQDACANMPYDANGLQFADTGKTCLLRARADVDHAPEGVKTVAYAAFAGTACTKITLPESVTKYGGPLFIDTETLEEVVFRSPASIKSSYLFSGAETIKTVTFYGGAQNVIIASSPSHITTVGFLTTPPAWDVKTKFPGATTIAYPAIYAAEWAEYRAAHLGFEYVEETTEEPAGAYLSYDLVDELGIEIPGDVDYAKGDKVTVKVEGLAKGLKVVATQQKETTGKKAVTNVVYTIEGVPTEEIDFETRQMYARVTTTYKDKTKGDKGKVETLQPIVLSITTPEPSVLTAGVLNQVYGPADIATLWPDVADAKVNPRDWTFKGWPAGIKYNNKATSASWSYKGPDGKSVKTNAEPWTVYGQPTKAGEFPITATWKHKLADGKTTVSETFAATMRVWADEDKTFWYSHAYVPTTENLTEAFGTVKSASGLPTGLKFKDGIVSGTPTKAGTFVVTLTLPDPADAKKTVKTSYLWKVFPPDAPAFALDTGTAPITDMKAQVVQGANLSFAIAATDGAKVSVSGLPSGLKLVQNKTTKLYTVEGIASKPGEYFVTFKTTLNGVTTVTTTAFTVKGNPFTAAYYGCALARPATNEAYRLAVAEVTVAAAGTVKLTYTEGKTKYTASVKSFEWSDATGKGTAEGLVLKASSADKQHGYGDRKATVTFENYGVYLRAKLIVNDANGSQIGESIGGMYATVKTTEVPLPASQTFVFRTEDGADTNAFATVSLAYDAKKATAAFSGKLYDGTAVKATVPVMRWDDDGKAWDYAFAPFLVIAKDGTVCCFNCFTDDDGGCINWVCDDGEWIEGVWSPDVDYPHADKKFAELVPEEGAFTFGWGSDAEIVGAAEESFMFEQTFDAKGKPAGVAIYDADAVEGEKPLATVTAKVGKATGAISFTFTSKKGDKAKYAVELVWRGEELFAGHVTRTWKASEIVGGKSKQVSHTAYGTVDVK